jgi:hypothetical protein
MHLMAMNQFSSVCQRQNNVQVEFPVSVQQDD